MDVSVNFIAGGDYGSDEDEKWYVNIIRVEPEGEDQQEFDDSWLELDGEKQSKEELPQELTPPCPGLSLGSSRAHQRSRGGHQNQAEDHKGGSHGIEDGVDQGGAPGGGGRAARH